MNNTQSIKLKACECHCHNDHEGAGLSNPTMHCKCLPNCEHCIPQLKKGTRSYEEIIEIVKAVEEKLQTEGWEEQIKMYLTSAGDRRRVISFIKQNFLEKEALKKEIEGMKIEWIQGVKLEQEEIWKHIINAKLDEVLELLK